MIFRPGVDGSSSGLFTPSRRALAGAAGRKREEDVIPAMTRPCIIADRRETVVVVVVVVVVLSSLAVLGVGVVDDFAEDNRDDANASLGERGVIGANASTEGTA